jgi:hypothetical protein
MNPPSNRGTDGIDVAPRSAATSVASVIITVARKPAISEESTSKSNCLLVRFKPCTPTVDAANRASAQKGSDGTIS